MDINKAIELYSLMVNRLDEQGFSPHQVRVYNEIIECIRECESAEAAMGKIKASPLYLAPTTALVRDKARALMLAALELDMADVAKIYEDKIAEIESSPEAVNNPDFYAEALRLKTRQWESRQAFSSIYCHYLEYKSTPVNDEHKIDSVLRDLHSAFSKLCGDFEDLSQRPHYRKLIAANTSGYNKFVEEVQTLRAQSIPTELLDVAKSQCESVREELDAIVANGQQYLERERKSNVVIVPPHSEQGEYEFKNEVTK